MACWKHSSTGQRLYDWARIAVGPTGDNGYRHWALARRSITDPTDIAFYACYAPSNTTMTDLARIAGRRWPVEECFQQAKNEAGLDDYQVRSYRASYAHTTLILRHTAPPEHIWAWSR